MTGNSDQQCPACPQAGLQLFRSAEASPSHRHLHLQTLQLLQPQGTSRYPSAFTPDPPSLPSDRHLPIHRRRATVPLGEPPLCIYYFPTALDLDKPVPRQLLLLQPRITTAHRRAHQPGIVSGCCRNAAPPGQEPDAKPPTPTPSRAGQGSPESSLPLSCLSRFQRDHTELRMM